MSCGQKWWAEKEAEEAYERDRLRGLAMQQEIMSKDPKRFFDAYWLMLERLDALEEKVIGKTAVKELTSLKAELRDFVRHDGDAEDGHPCSKCNQQGHELRRHFFR